MLTGELIIKSLNEPTFQNLMTRQITLGYSFIVQYGKSKGVCRILGVNAGVFRFCSSFNEIKDLGNASLQS